MQPRVIAVITARGGSKGIPGKNIARVGGKPLIAWSIEAALSSSCLSRVLVSTDSPEIARVATAFGAEVPFLRPAELATDEAPHIAVLEHVLQWLGQESQTPPDYLMTLQPTSPLRTAVDIDRAVVIAQTHEAIAVVSVCETGHHPYLAKTITQKGMLRDFLQKEIESLRRQDLPPVYALNGAIYLNRAESIRKDRTLLPAGTYAYIMPPERSLDIDAPWDLHLADLILRDKLGIKAD
ncbi:MAG: acylneuraminate cytidylyltransferase family protein [Desulfobacterota bacterium]|nr:acylneuraminate cytidylyltransferase family protein [Thermodesulfobacteriota bacterium]